MPDASLREKLWVSNTQIHSLQLWCVSSSNIQDQILQILSIASKPVLQTLNKYSCIL